MAHLLKNRLLREGGWVASGQVLGALAALVSIRIMTELLSPDEFGRLTLLVGAAALALGLVSTPRLQAVIRYYPEWSALGRLDVLRATAASLINSLVVVAVVLLATGGTILSLFSNQAWYTGLLVSALLAVDAGRAFELAFLNAGRRQRTAAIIQTADAWSRPVLAIVSVLLLGHSAEAALAGYVLGSSLVLLIMRRLVLLEGGGAHISSQDREIDEQRTVLSAAIKHYALPLAPLAVFGWLNGMGDRYVIAAVLDIADVGLYAAAYGLASRPFLMLSAVIEQTLRPVLQNAIASSDARAISLAKRRMIGLAAAGSAVGLLCFVLLSDVAAHVFLASEYRVASGLMQWVALGYAFLTVSSMYSRFCYSFDGTKYILSVTIISALVGLVVIIPAALTYGLIGAVVAVPIRFFVELCLSFSLAKRAERKFMRFAPQGRNNGR